MKEGGEKSEGNCGKNIVTPSHFEEIERGGVGAHSLVLARR